MTPRERRLYIPTLDGWRAIAICLVIGAHSVPALLNSGTVMGRGLASLFRHPGYGVDVFFALSGYLICTLLLQERELVGEMNLRRFYVRRAFRILPPVIGYLGVLIVLRALVLPEVSRSEILAVLAFARNYWAGSWYTGHFWSLAVEEHFYLLIPFLFSRLRWRAALRAAVALAIAIALCRFLNLEYGLGNGIFSGTDPKFRTENRFDALMCGAILALLLRRESIRKWLARRLSVPAVMALLVIVTVVLSLLESHAVHRSVLAIVMPLFIAHTVLRPTTMVSQLLELPLVRWIGRISYSLYLWQQLFLTPYTRPLGALQAFPFALAAAVMCAAGSYYLIEKPLIRLGHRLAASPLSPRLAASAVQREAPAQLAVAAMPAE
jgi:peptidoglycan/LPS O-acetylase OafA/YrhL